MKLLAQQPIIIYASIIGILVDIGVQAQQRTDFNHRSETGYDQLTSAARSLTKDILFFLVFVSQVVVLFIFFWQRRQPVSRQFSTSDLKNNNNKKTEDLDVSDDMKRINQRRIKISNNTNDASNNSKPLTDSELVDQHFAPIERTIDSLNVKIKSLERTLIERKAQYPTESMKVRLREAISQITNVLAAIDEVGKPSSPRTDDVSQIKKWVEQRKELELKRKTLEERLQARAAEQQMKASLIEGNATHTQPLAINMNTPPVSANTGKQSPRMGGSPRTPVKNSPHTDSPKTLTPKADLGLVSTSPRETGDQSGTSPAKSPRSTDQKPIIEVSPSNPNAAVPGVSVKEAPKSPRLQDIFKQPESPKTSSEPNVPTVDKMDEEDEELFKQINTKQLGKVMGRTKAGKKRGPQDTFDIRTAFGQDLELEQELDSRQKKKPRSISRAEAKKLDAEQYKSEDTEVTDLKKQLLASLSGFDEKPEDNQVSEPKTDAMDLLAALEGASSGKSEKDELLEQLNFDFNGGKTNELPTIDLNADLLASLKDLDAAAPHGDTEMVESISIPHAEELQASLSSEAAKISLQDLLNFKGTSDDENSGAESSSEEPRDTLVTEYFIKSDVNKAGMRRGRKKATISTALKGNKDEFPMEDINHVEIPFMEDNNKAFFAVFDGHAGKKAAEGAKKYLPKELATAITKKPADATDYSDIWKDVYLTVDSKLTKYEYEGTTSTTVLIWKVGNDRYIQAANVGDSTAFLVRDGEPMALTQDHRPTIPRERERITAQGIKLEAGQTRLNGLAVSRALGDHFPKEMNCGLIAEPYVSPAIKLNKNDSHLIIASDGLWDVLSGDAAYELIRELNNAEEMAATLLRNALKSTKCTDNVTVIVVRL
jgi:serine/threonine protein phosphatase PrpC/uncharacterized protein YqgV (UPF0045/DUF77 family)